MKSTNEAVSRPTVVIIGAGIAGLAAAYFLSKQEQWKIIVLEAENRVGGRVHTTPCGKGNVELGAQWIRGGEGNALWKFAMDSGLFNEDECFHTGEGCGVYYTDQSVEVDPTLVEDVRKVITTADRQCSKFVECQFDIQSLSCAGDFKLSSVGDVFHQAFVQHMDNCGDSFGISKIKESLYQWHVLYTCLDNACDSLHQLSALTWGEYKDTDDKYWLNIPAGFKTVTDAIYSRLPDEAVQMNKKVLTIDWGGDSSIDDSRESHHHQTEKSARKRKYFQACITCEGGSKYYANHVIVTVSLGVLKKCHKEMFTPTLPPKKCQIIQNMGYGTLNKIFLIFNEPFWDCTTQGFQFVWTEKHINREWDNLSDETYPWVQDITGFDVLPGHENVLLGWIGRQGAKIMETLSDHEVGEGCIKLLEKFLGRKTTQLNGIIRTHWHYNPNFYGSYSFRTVQSDVAGSQITDLEEPICCIQQDGKKHPVLLFAGEATERSHHSTVHGAFISGKREASRLIKFYEALQET